jgi:hypothetical protein
MTLIQTMFVPDARQGMQHTHATGQPFPFFFIFLLRCKSHVMPSCKVWPMYGSVPKEK